MLMFFVYLFFDGVVVLKPRNAKSANNKIIE